MTTYQSAYRKGCPVAIGFNIHGHVKPIYCGKWSCERCARQNAKLWAWRAYLGVERNNQSAWFWTLTMSGKIRSRKFAYSILPKLWNSLRMALQRAFGGKWSYIAFVEGQPKRYGMPHFHVISLKPAPKRLKDMAVKAGFGYQAYEKHIDGKGAAFYVAKYASKGDQFMPGKFRRCRTSQDWPKLPEFEGEAYLVPNKKESTLDFILRVHERTNVDVEELMTRYHDGWATFKDLDKG